jgi:hypothetical protein
MAHAVRMAWRAHRHWVAAGFLLSTSLFLLLVFLNWRSEQLGISQQRATGLSATTATTWDLGSKWSQRSLLPLSRQRVRMVDFASGMTGGVV